MSMRAMGTKDVRAILSAVDQAVAVCDRAERRTDPTRRQIAAQLRRVRTALRKRAGAGAAESP
jgi:hypothetical protein